MTDEERPSELEGKIAELAGDLYMIRTMRETLVNRGRFPEVVESMEARIGSVEDNLAKLRELRTARDYARRGIKVRFPDEIEAARLLKRKTPRG